jgi:hypothetical protein
MAAHIIYGALGALLLLIGAGALAYWVDKPAVIREIEEREARARRNLANSARESARVR